MAAITLLCLAGIVYSFWPTTASGASGSDRYRDGTKVPAVYSYGFNLDSFELDYFELQPNDFLGDILAARGIEYETIDRLARVAEDTFSVRKLRPGKKCALVRQKGTGYVDCFVYEPNAYEYVLFHLYEEPSVQVIERDVRTCVETATGVLNSSLWVTMVDQGHPIELISRMEDALAWSVSFHHVQKGDSYKLIYERNYIDGAPVGVGKLLAATFNASGKDVNSIYFEANNYAGYFDEEGRPMKRAFLKAPVRYSRISSHYSSRRFHPVLKRYKGHFGTDYAADRGTPIMAVADGTISKASYTNGNGNYVKIRHDQTYETQYLHMSKFASGIRPGVHVKQGDIIGYVGQTGLATGPHVCFRFWKNGKQVDHLKENLPPPEPMPQENMPAYERVRDEMIMQLHAMSINPEPSPAT